MTYVAVKPARFYRRIYIHQDYVGPLDDRRATSPRRSRLPWPLLVTVMVHSLLGWTLLRAPARVEQVENTGRAAIEVTWLAAVPSWAEPAETPDVEPVRQETPPPPPALVVLAEPPPAVPEATPSVALSPVPPLATVAEVRPTVPEVAATPPAPPALAARAESNGQADTNYWLEVRAEITRCLRWPPGPRQPATVDVQLTLDEHGGLHHVEATAPTGEERFARGVEQAVRRAAPFAAPGAWSRSARLPVRFVVENRTER